MFRANLPQPAALGQLPTMPAAPIAQVGYNPSPYFAMALMAKMASDGIVQSRDPKYSKYYIHDNDNFKRKNYLGGRYKR